MTQNPYDFGAIISATPINGVTTPTNAPALQIALSEALRNYILGVGAEPLAPIAFLGCCHIQYNFEFPIWSPSASAEKSEKKSFTHNGKRLKGLVVNVNVTYGAG